MKEIEYLPWDSENFGFKVGRFSIRETSDFKLDHLSDLMTTEAYDLVYLVSPTNLGIDAFYDNKLTYSKAYERNDTPLNAHVHSYKGRHLTEKLLELSFESGKYSRYRLDNKFPQDKFQYLYRKWIENSLLTEYATDVLVYEDEGNPIGLLTYRISKNNASIGIIATHPNFQGCGIGSSLMRHFESILPESVETLEVVTQGINLSARKFYEKFGYTVAESCYVYHIWSK